MFPPRLLVVHNPSTRCQHNVAKLTTWQQLDDPLFEVSQLDIVSRRDDTGLINAAVELNDDFAIAVIINFFELANVALKELALAEI